MAIPREIFVRALPEKYKIDEIYFYNQTFSNKNPSLQYDDKTNGKILVVIPYDGHKYFTRKNTNEILKYIRKVGRDDSDYVKIGQILFSDYAKTDIGKSMKLLESYDAIPLKIQFKGEGFPNELPFNHKDDHVVLEYLKHLVEDRYTCEITHAFKPAALPPKTFDIHVKVSDPDSSSLDENDACYDVFQEYLDGHTSDRKVIESLRREVYFQSNIMVTLDIFLNLSKSCGDSKPVIAKFSIAWPYVPSAENVYLYPERFEAGADQALVRMIRNAETGRIDPKGEHIVWTGIPFTRVKDDSMAIFRIKGMNLFFKHPVDLFDLEKLKGNIEMKIPGTLLSGLNVRIFDASGRMVKDIESKEKESQINVNFEIELREFFKKRKRTHGCIFHVDEILLDDADASHVETELKNRGYQIDPLSINRRFNPLVIAHRKSGSGTTTIWINMEITPKSPHRIRDIGGQQVFSSQISSGTIRLYMRGEALNTSGGLMREINSLQQAIRLRFKKLSYKY